MSARHALLGLLLDRDSYPYELSGRLASRLGPAWNLNSGQVSQICRSLERDDLIERVEPAGSSRERRQFYRIRPSGAQNFEQWFSKADVSLRRLRRPLMAKLALAGPDRLREAQEQIDAQERACATRLKELQIEHSGVPNEPPVVRADHVLLRLSLRADILQLEGELQWAEEARKMISWLSEQEAMWPSARERRDAASETARRARSKLFARMAAKASLPAPQPVEDADAPDGIAGARRKPSDMGG